MYWPQYHRDCASPASRNHALAACIRGRVPCTNKRLYVWLSRNGSRKTKRKAFCLNPIRSCDLLSRQGNLSLLVTDLQQIDALLG